MAEQYIGILLELYDTQQATAYSNLVVGIVFGEFTFSVLQDFVSRDDGSSNDSFSTLASPRALAYSTPP